MNICILYDDMDLLMYMNGERLKWVGHVVRMFENTIPKLILEGSLGGRGPAGKLRSRWKDYVWKDATK